MQHAASNTGYIWSLMEVDSPRFLTKLSSTNCLALELIQDLTEKQSVGSANVTSGEMRCSPSVSTFDKHFLPWQAYSEWQSSFLLESFLNVTSQIL